MTVTQYVKANFERDFALYALEEVGHLKRKRIKNLTLSDLRELADALELTLCELVENLP